MKSNYQHHHHHMLDYWIDSDEKEGSLQTSIDIFIIRCIKHLL